MAKQILAIDQGTTNTKALVLDEEGCIVARGSIPTPVHYPRPGWVEQDPREIWQCTLEAIAACLASGSVVPSEIVAVGIANQRETALLWDRQTGDPVGPAVVWQCRRSAPLCRDLKESGREPILQAITGLQIDPMFSGSKFRWLLDHSKNGYARALNGDLCAGNVDAWLLWNLTGGPSSSAVHATDVTNASRTLLMNLEHRCWDPDALDILGIPREILPEIGSSSGVFGRTAALSLPGERMLPPGIPVASMIGDSHASLYGLGGFRPGSIKATYGTGTSVMTPTAEVVRSDHGLSSTVAWALGDAEEQAWHETVVYALEGNIYTTGGAVQYVGELLGLEEPASGIEALARTVVDSAGVVFVPALVGLGAPHWDDGAKGTITGLTLGTGRGHLARAALEAIAFQIRDIYDVMQAEAGIPLEVLLADGGASQNDLLMQVQADVLGCPIERSQSSEISPLGAALLAGLAVGIWRDEEELASLLPDRNRFEPTLTAVHRDEAYAKWQQAVAKTRYDATANSGS